MLFGISGCSSPALTWFFRDFDINQNGLLDEDEQAEIISNPNEHCMRKFFDKCDLNADNNLSLNEVCACFMHVG